MSEVAQDTWVFAYGSLMWRPGFEYVERQDGLLYGHHRGFCVYSFHHRGTKSEPGLVLGLDRGGACRGVLYRVAGAVTPEALAYLREREQVTMVYLEKECRVRNLSETDPREVRALTYVVDRAHEQYAGKLPHERQVEMIVRGVGLSGKNPDYLQSTLAHLTDMGIKDRKLSHLWHDVNQDQRRRLARR